VQSGSTPQFGWRGSIGNSKTAVPGDRIQTVGHCTEGFEFDEAPESLNVLRDTMKARRGPP
jgi:hypothetical protein